ncbi:uncharacterized protein LOC135807071 [Sycon ciliatum]|uniref:uncharacterized protein LOC135807071 n=1 Tax=Sycon ciliatum TaxID=27933 RepID=UPI0020A9931D|eukprot:scpid71768/ scgid21835/ 
MAVATKLWRLGLQQAQTSGLSSNSAPLTPLIVLAHGVKFCKEIWQPVVKEVERRLPEAAAVDFVAFDLPGHGDSALPQSVPVADWVGMTVEAAHIVLAQYANGHAPVMALAHSFGAAALMRLEAQQPGTFSRILAFEPIFIPHAVDPAAVDLHEFPLAVKARQQKNGWPDIESARRYFQSRRAFSTWSPDVLERYLTSGLKQDPDSGEWLLKCNPLVEADVFAFPPSNFSDLRLSEQTCKYAIAYGELSRNLDLMAERGGSCTAELYVQLASLLPGLKHPIVCPGTGHLMVCEQPDLVAKHCLHYLLGSGLYHDGPQPITSRL